MIVMLLAHVLGKLRASAAFHDAVADLRLSRLVVMLGVATVVYQFQILGAVIGAIAVLVVYVFGWQQRSLENALHHKTMFLFAANAAITLVIKRACTVGRALAAPSNLASWLTSQIPAPIVGATVTARSPVVRWLASWHLAHKFYYTPLWSEA